MTLITSVSVKTTCTPGVGVLQFKWSKNTTANGYDIQYATDAGFSDAVTVSNLKSSRIRYKGYGLKQGKTYYVRLRTYKTVGGKKYYSAWSAKKAVKISK